MPAHPSAASSQSNPSSLIPLRPSSPLFDHTINYISSRNEPFGRWLRKHADDPLLAGKRWLVEHFQFGACVLDPSGLTARYNKLVAWNGKWVNYWTNTTPRSGPIDADSTPSDIEEKPTGSHTSLQPTAEVEGSISSAGSSTVSLVLDDGDRTSDIRIEIVTTPEQPHKETNKNVKLAKKKMRKAMKKARHFVVRPSIRQGGPAGADKWELVTIEGVNDEVAAHCGLFIRGQNLDCEGLIERVGQKIMDWCHGV